MENSSVSPSREYDLMERAGDYPERAGPPERSLVVCSQPRSGSTLLGEAIYFAGGLGNPLEYFHAGFRPKFERRWKPASFSDYVARLYRSRTDPSGVFGLKLFWVDVVDLLHECAPDEFAFLDWRHPGDLAPETHRRIFGILRDFIPNPTFVFLTRRDEIRQAVSHVVAGRSRAWRQFPRQARKDLDAEYEFHRILQYLGVIQRHNGHWRDFFRANALACHRIVYEDLEADYEGTLRKFFAAVGRPDAPIPPPRLQKQADARSEALVQRFRAEFRQRASATPPPPPAPDTPSN
ncbi:MAG TPA: Stf0 family sulfotransferase [Alphaproteobacteria bacterium]|nr:Stf0 family sulfotransferase [Alphaproteobacteria bacterium]